MDQLRTNPSLQYVLLIARWTEYSTTRLNKTAFAPKVDGLIRLGLKTTNVRQMPEPKADVPRFFALSKRWTMRLHRPGTNISSVAKGWMACWRTWMLLVRSSTPVSLFLNGELGSLQHDNRPLYFGANHLSSYGAIHAAEAMSETFRQMAQP